MWIDKIFYSQRCEHVLNIEPQGFYIPIHLYTRPTTTATTLNKKTLT